jgi:coniferyl-aldehyde dehydrogenase
MVAKPEELKMENTLDTLLAKQKQAQIAQGFPSLAQRKQWLQRCIDLLVDNQEALCKAVDEDFGGRPEHYSLLEIQVTLTDLKHTRKHIAKWMKPERRPVMFPLGLFGGRAHIDYQPKGVVGVMSPWNYPIQLSLVPLAQALAAGNRSIIKPSEYTPKTSDLLQELIGRYFSDEEVAVVTGGPDVGASFSALPFDHLIFTGATSIGKHVMAAAAKNLTPVTLELGGKSPVIVAPSANIEDAAEKILIGKVQNAGQVCIAPDYVFVEESSLETFISCCRNVFSQQYPDPINNQDYTAIINGRHYQRINSYIEEAAQAGTRIVPLSDAEPSETQRKLPMKLIVNPNEELTVSQEEIFGPVLAIKTYNKLSECVDYINAQPKPLALYFFGRDKSEQDFVLGRTSSGGVTVNDLLMHVGQPDLPFGGVGDSGMGHYHGHEGFKTFSHSRAVYKQGFVNPLKLMGALPPYSDKLKKLLKSQIKK